MGTTDAVTAVSLFIGPDEISSYLARSGWNVSASSRVAEIWTSNRADSSDSELLVPRIVSAADFEIRRNILLQDLQSYEQRPGEDIRDEMSRQFVDVTDVSAGHKLDNSVFPLDAGHKLFYSAKKMVIAAAAATLKRRGYFGHSVPKRAREQARNVLVGHTRPGSYVVPVITKARVPDASWDDDRPRLVEEVEELSYDRRMVVTLAKGLTALHELGVGSGTEPTNRDVYDGVREGISYELCDGVLRSLRDPTVQNFEVGFKWAPAVSLPLGVRRSVVFPSESVPRLRRIARGLRKDIEDREQVIYGWVEVLSSKAEDVGGSVRVHAIVGGKRRVIRMTLEREDYQKAVESHKRCSVMVRGDLHIEEGKQPVMNVHLFELEQRLPNI
ncbi:hypothetical protein [Micromonospora chokoriensis]|uniref:hypothetical protein n=1 Tax=Micromonospora chokoriensis TaxID=356851 RepID=UPI0012FAF678|nr:hypothetical protein [Micromonospora chokoriensis]